MDLRCVCGKRDFAQINEYNDEELQGDPDSELSLQRYIPHHHFDEIPGDLINRIIKDLTFEDLNNLLLVGLTFWKIFKNEDVHIGNRIPEHVFLDMDLEDQEPTIRTRFWASCLEQYITETGDEEGEDIEFDISKINNVLITGNSKINTFMLSFLQDEISVPCKKLALELENCYENFSQIRTYFFDYRVSEKLDFNENNKQLFELICKIKKLDDIQIKTKNRYKISTGMNFKIYPILKIEGDNIRESAIFKKNFSKSMQKFSENLKDSNINFKFFDLKEDTNEDGALELRISQIIELYKNKIAKTYSEVLFIETLKTYPPISLTGPTLYEPCTYIDRYFDNISLDYRTVEINNTEDATAFAEILKKIKLPNLESLVFTNKDELSFNVFFGLCKEINGSNTIKNIQFTYNVNNNISANFENFKHHINLFKELKTLILTPTCCYRSSITNNALVQILHEDAIKKLTAFAKKNNIELKIDLSQMRTRSIDVDDLLEANSILTDDEDFRSETHEFIDGVFSLAEDGIVKAAAL